MYTYPVEDQLDVPAGARLVVSYAEPVAGERSADCTLRGPDGAVPITVATAGAAKTLVIAPAALAPGTRYELAVGELRVHFTTRDDRPRAGAPTVVAVNGSAPDRMGTFRPILETSTLQLVFSEPMDPRTVALEAGALELVDVESGMAVPATLLARGIHATIDPHAPLAAGKPYELRLGDRLADLGGERLVATAVAFTPLASVGAGVTPQTLRTRRPDDPVPGIARLDSTNTFELAHPLIGSAVAALAPGAIRSELGDPQALADTSIAFTIPRGQRLRSAPVEVALGGVVPSGLATGDLVIELVADAGGRIYRNRFRDPETAPDNVYAPLQIDLALDLAVFATDPVGNTTLAQTVLGVQVGGLVMADEGVLAIETLGAMDFDLLGLGTASTNLALQLISDPDATIETDAQAPALANVAPPPASHDLVADEAIELAFDEPIDLDRARAGGVVLLDGSGAEVASGLELHGSVLAIRPRAPLVDGGVYHVDLRDVADVAGNAMAPQTLAIATQTMAPSDAPPRPVAVYPGTACALVGANDASAGRCAGGGAGDDTYRPFSLAANERVFVRFDRAIAPASVGLGTACGSGSVRIEHLDAAGACIAPVAGALLVRRRELAFVAGEPWIPGERYRLRLVGGANAGCDAGELCGTNGRPATFAAIAGATGGPDLVVDFVGTPATGDTTLVASASPYADLNASGRVDAGEARADTNRVALRIAGTSGLLDFARFEEPDCQPATPEAEACMYMTGVMPAQLGASRTDCELPDGSVAATCVPVRLAPQIMFGTSVRMTAGALGIGIPADTGKSIMRMREPADRPLEGFIVERNGGPVMVVALDLYMDAPGMSLPLAQHDLHSKPLSVMLEGPVRFGLDGRIAIELVNLEDVPISVGISAPFGITGAVDLVVPPGEMRLQLRSPALRGGLR